MRLSRTKRRDRRPDQARAGSGRAAAFLSSAQTVRQRHATAPAVLSHLRAIAGDPHLYLLAAQIAQARADARSHVVGGRPATYPDWALIVFGAAIRVFGSASGVAREFADPFVWQLVTDGARQVLGPAVDIGPTGRGPSRDQWNYYLKTHLAPRGQLIQTVQGDLGVALAREMDLLDPSGSWSLRPDRANVVAIDGKVFSSPLRTLETERVDKTTGEIKQVRQDPARHLYGEAGEEGVAWGSKYAIASTRSPMANQRVILGVTHVPHIGGGGEAGCFTRMIKELGGYQGIHAVVADGALRGAHIAAIQHATGVAVVSPPRRKDKKHGGIMIGTHGYAAHQLGSHRSRDRWTCGGHDLWAAGGTIHERFMLVDGSTSWTEVPRGQVKRDRHQAADGTISWQLHAHYTLTCHHSGGAGQVHSWWERLTTTDTDQQSRFNRSDYLRAIPGHHPGYQQVYRMRQDAESLNNTLERAFYGQRLPAWGTPNQTIIVLLACLAQNSWARHTWQAAQQDLERRQTPAA